MTKKHIKSRNPLCAGLLAAAISMTCWKAQAQEAPIPHDMIGIVQCPQFVAQYGAKDAGTANLQAPAPDSAVFVKQVDNILADDKYADVSGPSLYVDPVSHRFTMIYWQMIALDWHKFIGNDDDFYIMNDDPKIFYKVGAVLLNADVSGDSLRRPSYIIAYGANPLAKVQDQMAHLPHAALCESPDQLNNPVCVAYQKNVGILTRQKRDIEHSMMVAADKAKAGLNDMLTKINRCARNWDKYGRVDYRLMP